MLFSAVFVHAQVESLAGHNYFRDLSQKPGYDKEQVSLAEDLFIDTMHLSFGKKLKRHFTEDYRKEVLTLLIKKKLQSSIWIRFNFLLKKK